jgi:hydrogenase maturation factor
MAECEGRGRRERLNIMLLGEVPADAWVLAYQGSAIRRISEDEALQTRAALAALDAAMSGTDDFSAFFADLESREPTLPPHLIPSSKEAAK